MSERLRFRRPGDDPGPAWADEVLGPLRRRRADVDVTSLVMQRIAANAPRPLGAPFTGAWARAAWAAAFAGGFLALALLVGTAGVMIANGDEGARSVMALLATGGRLAVSALGHLGALAGAFLTATLAFLKGAWILVEVAAPVVRGGTFVAALGGVMSLGISLVIITRARRTAPAVSPHEALNRHGGLA